MLMGELFRRVTSLLDDPNVTKGTQLYYDAINQAMGEIWQEVFRTRTGFYHKEYETTTSTTTNVVDLPADSSGIIRKVKILGIELEYRNFDVFDKNSSGDYYSGYPAYYDIITNDDMSHSIILDKIPTSGTTISIFYYRMPVEMTGPKDVVFFPRGFESLIVYKACAIRALATGADTEGAFQEQFEILMGSFKVNGGIEQTSQTQGITRVGDADNPMHIKTYSGDSYVISPPYSEI